ncbi:hypothetical protein BACEGG_00599 [Bacteroides eggerthii DSM 20697]|nr:hypothetical protein BACEGG_00599 [Bacteroides eggerthii DSM 20697]
MRELLLLFLIRNSLRDFQPLSPGKPQSPGSTSEQSYNPKAPPMKESDKWEMTINAWKRMETACELPLERKTDTIISRSKSKLIH